jgi:ABC-type antimicrobial peptide transport system permease subunit
VTQRTREIGVRIALGASAREVVALVLGQGLRPAIAGLGAGLAAAWMITRVLQGLLFGVQPHDPATFATVSATLVAVVVAACAVPALRASRVAPVDALRSE